MENNNVPKKPGLPNVGAKPSSPAKPTMPKVGASAPIKPQAPVQPKAPFQPQTPVQPKPSTPTVQPSGVGSAKPQTQQVATNRPQTIDRDSRERVPEKKLEDKSLDRYTKEDREIIKKQMSLNDFNHKKRRSAHKPLIKSKSDIKATHKAKPAKLYGSPIYEVLQARKRALAGGVIVVKKRKKKLFLIILLLLLLFGAVAGSSYVLMGNVINNQASITENDINFNEEDKRDFEVETVRNYMPGEDIEKQLRIKNTANNVGVYVAYKFNVKEIDGTSLKDIDLVAEPYLLGEPNGQGGTSKWTIGQLNNGDVFYYSNEVLSSNDGENQITLFERYKLSVTNGLDENYLAGKQVKVTVTVYVLQEGYANINASAEGVWSEAPSSWKTLMNK